MIIRSKAPLRIGLAGGGTDVSPYCDRFGGAILNVTLSLYAHATIKPRTDGKIILHSIDKDKRLEFDSLDELPLDGCLDLVKGIYNRVVKDYAKKALSFEMTTSVDAPPGSGLGTSSTLVVAILGAFAEWLKLPLGEYDLAYLAYDIERKDLGMAGGKQDQYAATFGGVNFMEFFADEKVIVNPLRIRQTYLDELAHNLILYNLETSRLSSKIIELEQKHLRENAKETIEAMHQLKKQASLMKNALLKGEIDKIGNILDFGWQHKKKMAKGISNPMIDEIYQVAMNNGSTGGKISGAGGGGFMFFYCPENTKHQVIEALNSYKGKATTFEFVTVGLRTWSL